MTTTVPATAIVAPRATLGDLAASVAELPPRYPEAGPRVQHGAFLALMGHAELSTPRAWWMTSERDATIQYLVLEDTGRARVRTGRALCVETLPRLERCESDRIAR